MCFIRPMPLGPAAGADLKCSESGCKRDAIARGLCRQHYQKKWSAGELKVRVKREPLAPTTIRMPAEMHSAFRKLQRISGRTQTSLIEEALSEYLTKFKLWPPAVRK